MRGVSFLSLTVSIGLTISLLIPSSAAAQFENLSDGSDGTIAYGCCSTFFIDLSEATTGNWNDPVPAERQGKGIYDPNIWAVVYKYDSVTLHPGAALRFYNHGSGAPVVWLVKNDVVIHNGSLLILDANGNNPGPGGFAGGRGSRVTERAAGGFGPGGATLRPGAPGAGGGYATAGSSGNGAAEAGGNTYGNAQIFPLIGGSGGAGQDVTSGNGDNGGAGGGAILIVAQGKIVVNGQIQANGASGGLGGGGGSGGAIRLIAPIINGTGTLSAIGADVGDRDGGSGRIRLESFNLALTDTGSPEASRGVPDNPLKLFPDASTPSIRAVTLAGISVPSDPRPLANDVSIEQAGTYALNIQANNVPTDSTVEVYVTPRTGQDQTVAATLTGGNLASSTWTAQLQLKEGSSTIQVRAILP